MPTLHDGVYRAEIAKRLGTLRHDSPRRWGKMSVDQMLWHVNEALASALGDIEVPAAKPPLPRSLIKFMVLNLPWMKGAPTLPIFVAADPKDFAAERARCMQLIDRVADKSIDGAWPWHPMFGPMTGKDVSRLHAKHLNHHLTQFGV